MRTTMPSMMFPELVLGDPNWPRTQVIRNLRPNQVWMRPTKPKTLEIVDETKVKHGEDPKDHLIEGYTAQ